ncbi:MAG TPA: thiamine-phosphate kinase [Terriglobales bacterium]|nr:thiamine-phosphate kinase [Terriglobales bacterium]
MRWSFPYDVFILPLPERLLISKIGSTVRAASLRKQLKLAHAREVIVGMGDDCAVIRTAPGHEILVTTDFSLEGVHFRREWHGPESVGHRCLARGLSDIAAMGAEPTAAFLSLALPVKTRQAWVDGFMRGLLKLADEFGVTLAGGDTAQSPSAILADIVVLGSISKGKAILRSGARPGDKIYVTGTLGGSAAALHRLFSTKTKLNPKQFRSHLFPIPRIRVGEFLGKHKIPSAMIDLSDGLSTDLSHICESSGVGAKIYLPAIPLARVGHPLRPVDLKFALHGGEDYELLFTAPANRKVPSEIEGVLITCIGQITKNKQMVSVHEGVRSILRPAGWQHFRKSRPR